MQLTDLIFINQLAQGTKPFKLGEDWFARQLTDERVAALREINALIMQASPTLQDAEESVARSGLKETAPQCVLVRKPNLKVQLAKIANLPESEQKRSFRLLVTLLSVADERRRKSKPLDLVRHWWHRDLSDERVIQEIIRENK